MGEFIAEKWFEWDEKNIKSIGKFFISVSAEGPRNHLNTADLTNKLQNK